MVRGSMLILQHRLRCDDRRGILTDGVPKSALGKEYEGC
ncbi:hypothetical protein TSMEX_007754 [Taenia solium]|eukprot:TsM_000117200 transcript=TsM_000117200 gene=TsM_000117200